MDIINNEHKINDAILYMQTYKDMNFSPDAFLADDGGFIAPEFLQTLGDDGNYILTRATWSKDLAETNMPSDKLIMPWDGIRFDHETHQNILGKCIIYQIIDQEYYTVWPWNLATKVLIWPMPRWEEKEQVR